MIENQIEFTILDYMSINTVYESRKLDIYLIKEFLAINSHLLKTRFREYVLTRRYLSYILTHKLGCTRRLAGDILGGRDHSTIVHNIKMHHQHFYMKDKLYMSVVSKVDKDLEKFRRYGE